MDKVTPKSDVFKANLERAAPLLKALRADGIGHMIDSKIAPSISGLTFETKSPIDGAREPQDSKTRHVLILRSGCKPASRRIGHGPHGSRRR